MGKFWSKLQKWKKVILWILAIFVVLVVVVFAAWRIWLSTWKTYTNSDFGFSFRYPSSWHVIINLPLTKQQVDKNGLMSFNIDSREILPNSPADPLRSPGDVQVDMRKDNSVIEAHKLQKDFSKLKTESFGDITGLVDSMVSRTSYSGGLFVFSNDLYIKSGNLWYFINSLSISKTAGFFSKINAEFYNRIGFEIIGSFKFTK